MTSVTKYLKILPIALLIVLLIVLGYSKTDLAMGRTAEGTIVEDVEGVMEGEAEEEEEVTEGAAGRVTEEVTCEDEQDVVTTSGDLQLTGEYDLQTMTVEETIALFSFLSSPIEGAQVTSAAGQLPNAPRRYRNGIHEGIDYYGFERGTPVLAAYGGVVIRADHGFIEMTLEEYNEAVRISREAPITPEKKLDKFRGKQVWIKHQNNIITRYAHLDSILSCIKVGQVITKGQEIGSVGNSGTKSSVVGEILSVSGAPHLHFEIWLDGIFLGKDRPLSEVIDIFTAVLDE